MHLFMMAKAHPQKWDSVYDFFRSIPLERKNGKETFPAVNEIKIFDIKIPEECASEFLEHTRNFTFLGHYEKNEPEKIAEFQELINTMSPLDQLNYPPFQRNRNISNRIKFPQGVLYLLPLGMIKDERNEKGEEMI